MKHRRQQGISVRTKFIFIIAVILVPLGAMLLLMSKNMSDNVWGTLTVSYEHELELYVSRMDDELHSMEQKLKNMAGENWADLTPDSPNSEIARYAVWEQLQKIRKEEAYVDAAYLKTCWDDYTVLTHDIEKITFSHKEELLSYLADADLQAYRPLSFALTEVGGCRFLIDQISASAYSFGLLTSVDTILDGARKSQLYEGEQFYLVDPKGRILSENAQFAIALQQPRQRLTVGGLQQEFQLVCCMSEQMGYGIVRAIPVDAMKKTMPPMERALRLVCMLSLLLIPAMFVAVRRLVLRPLSALNDGMHEIEKENLEFRMKEEESSSEFRHMNKVFNEMVEQIRTLRIETYEKDIERLKMEAANLRLQINPHLLLNSLNMIYSLAQSKNHPLILKYTSCLMEYFRYSLRKNDALVALDDEMNFVVNYLEIQKIRFPDAFVSVYDIDEELHKALLPPLLIENFVENCMKYALKLGETIEIMLVIKRQEDCMTISIVDTGNGMSEEILKKLRAGEPVVDRTGNHIGILNCRRRLALFYGGRAELSVNSTPGSGTQVWIRLPLWYEDRTEMKRGELISEKTGDQA